MVRVAIYLWRDKVVIPETARVEAGYFLEVDPVRILPAADLNSIRSALTDSLNRGNPACPTPDRSAFPEPVVLRALGLRSWHSFVRQATSLTIDIEYGKYVLKDFGRSPHPHCDAAIVADLAIGVTIEAVAGAFSKHIHDLANRSDPK